jgi:tetratricopeptide (TPR) repeat protein
MQVDTNYAQLAALSVLAGTSSAPTAGTSSSSSSLFGPAALLSLGGGATTADGEDYSYLGVSRSTVSALPQFNLSAVLAAKAAGADPLSASPKLRSEQAATLKQVADLVDQERYDEARELIDELRRKDPASGPATQALGVIELRQHHYEKAERLFRQAQQLAPDRGYDQYADIARILQKDDAEVFATARRMVAASDTYSEGLRLLYGLTERNPLHAEARLLLADSLLKEHDAAGGLAQYRLALITADHAQLERIEERLETLVKIAPQAAYVRRLLGQAQLQLGQPEQAAATLAEATKLAQDDPAYRAEEAPAQLALGREKLDRGDIAGALASFERAQGLDFTSPEVRLALAEAYVARGELNTRQGSLTAAIHDFNAAAAQLGDGGDAVLRQRLARSAFAAGQLVETQHLRSGADVGDELVAYWTAYDADPDNPVYRSKWAELGDRLGEEFLADARYQDAADAFQRAYDLFPGNAAYRAHTVNACTLSGDRQMDRHEYDGAIAAYRAAYEIEHGDDVRSKLAAAHNARGLTYLAEGRIRLARADFLQAVRLDGEKAEYQSNYSSVAG